MGVGLGGIALIAGGAWWGFKKGRERQVVENLAPAPEYTGGEHGGNGGAPSAVVGADADEEPAGTMRVAELYGTDGRVEMEA